MRRRERSSTPLELLFDLCFVVAVAILAATLHEGVDQGRAVAAVVAYGVLFVPVWWAWMSYTWFATAYSHDDPLNRLLTLAQMAGVLAVAGTIPAATRGNVLPFTITYALMRLPLILQWVRAARDDAAHRPFAMRYAVGSAVAQVLWVAGGLTPRPWGWGLFAAAIVVELVTPILAVRTVQERVYHPGHIAERYGLFTLIVIGETILAVAVGLRASFDEITNLGDVALVVSCGLVIAFSMWWLYFDGLGREGLRGSRSAAFVWGYGHYVLFASLAAIGAGVQTQLVIAFQAHTPAAAAAVGRGEGVGSAVGAASGGGAHLVPGFVGTLAVAVPLALVLATIAWLQITTNGRTRSARVLVLAVLAVAVVAALSAVIATPVGEVALALISALTVGAHVVTGDGARYS